MSSPSPAHASTCLTDLPPDPPNLTSVLKLDSKRILKTGSFSVIYRCLYTQGMKVVVVKAIAFPPGFDPTEKHEFERKVRRELAIWKRLDHPNIALLLGTACGNEFGSDYLCAVSTFMSNGSLLDYVEQRRTSLSLPARVRLIKGSASGLAYLHSQGFVHGDFHPNNILIDDNHVARLTDFGFSQTLCPMSTQFSYLYTKSVRPGAVLWAAPELVYPGLYPKLKFQATFQSDIYSLGSIISFVLSGEYPWRDRGEAEKKLKEFRNPPRPMWPVNIPDNVWGFIERCWSPRDPESRPSAQEVFSFSDKLEETLRPNINVVLFGDVGSGKSSVINLLAGEPVALESSGVKPCTERPRSYQVSIQNCQFRLWDTMGFSLAREGSGNLLPYEHAHAVLRNLPHGVSLILLCANKGMISPSLRRLYWLINDFFYAGRSPIAFIVTHFDKSDEQWWDRNKRDILERTTIPVQSIPHACVTTDPAGRDRSKHALQVLLQTRATSVTPILLRPDLSSHTTISELATNCRLSSFEVTELVKKFSRPLRRFNVVFFGETGDEMKSIISLIAGRPVVAASPGGRTCTLGSSSCRISTGMQQFCIWDTMCINEVHIDNNVYMGALENASQLIHNLSEEGGIDLLVFCKRFGRKFTPGEVNSQRLYEETLRKGRFPVAVIVTHFESARSEDKWWQMKGKGLVKSIGGDVIGHTCIPPLANYDPNRSKLDKARVEARLRIESMLEDCVSSRRAGASKVRGIFEMMMTSRWGQKTSAIRIHGDPLGLTRQPTV